MIFLRRTALALCLLLLCPLSSCAVLFFSDANTSSGGTWIGTNQFVEIQTEFERKSHWFPLNQNAITRNYATTLILHTVKNQSVEGSAKLAHFEGWTLNDSLFQAGSSLIFLRGKSDSYGDMKRELVSVPFPGPGEARVLLSTDESILAAVPSPDGKLVAVFLTTATNEDRNNQLFVEFYELGSSFAKHSRISVPWSGVPGNPELAWAKDSRGLSLHLENSVVYLAPGAKSPKPAASFPVCFIQTTSGRSVSDSGLFFSRNQEGTIEIKKEEVMRFVDVPVTQDIQELGRGCP